MPLVGGGYVIASERSQTFNGSPSIELSVQLYDANRQPVGERVVVGRAFSDPITGRFATIKGYDLAASPFGGFHIVYIGDTRQASYSPVFSIQSGAVFNSSGQLIKTFGYDYAVDLPTAPHLIPLINGGVIVQQDWSSWFYDANGKLLAQLASPGTGDFHDLGTIIAQTTTRADGTVDQWLMGLDAMITSTAIVKTLEGTAGDDKLVGSTGPDRVSAGAGNDTLTGGFGFDVLTGGAGADRFVFGLDGSIDWVADFDPTQDTLQITDLQGGALPAVSAGLLTFDGRSHILYWDDDGAAGAHSPIAVALLDGVDHLRLANILGVQPAQFVNITGLGVYEIVGSGVITGGALADTLTGGTGADTLSGGGGDDVITGGEGSDVIDGGAGVDTARYADKASSFKITIDETGWKIADLRTGHTTEVDTLRNVEFAAFADKTLTLGTQSLGLAVASVLRARPDETAAQALLADLYPKVSTGQMSPTALDAALTKAAISTTSVATLSYEFFTGKIPTQVGVDFLVSTAGGNANNLNSAYYAPFDAVNRYINFAMNLGKNGEGRAAFEAKYGALSLFDATKEAYRTIFGGTPTDAKVHSLIDTRVDYLAYYGGDGPSGIGTKAAMVGFLLAAGATEHVGVMARSNDAWLADLSDGSAPFAVDIIDPAKGYYRADFIFGG
ncbi:calcium-binding protein [Caulobacter sp. FWC2]|uniref:calcium-binding protein n=1 Tax=Caulobacter sp. FWC2 TaxID=69664 RepID=UPI000C15DDB8|nr:calcium-binding protein [Caulobacter sp. FWC2]PIB93778.1 hypothetical protein CSW62_20665 [Caulobacter sp. FWC2]